MKILKVFVLVVILSVPFLSFGQNIIVSGVIKDSFKKQEVIMKKEISEQEKNDEIKGITEISNTKVLEFLNKDQKIKFKTMIGQ